MEFHFLLLALATVVTVAVAGPQGRITNGHLARERQFTYLVGLSHNKHSRSKPFCGGTVLSKYWVVTAAHCVDGLSSVNLRFGSNNYTSPRYNVTSTDIIIHPKYVPIKWENDIALIKTPVLPISSYISSYIWPAVLPPTYLAKDELVDVEVIAAGWGNGAPNEMLNYATFRIISNKECAKSHPNITKSKMCVSTYRGTSSPCYGDSGGPLILKGNTVIVGIISFGYGCVSEMAGFARVTEFLPWIQEVSGLTGD